jgi:hypothetical protein
MAIKINCVYINNVAWCKNKNIKRSLWGLGARCCVEYPPDISSCEFKEKYSKPKNISPAHQ